MAIESPELARRKQERFCDPTDHGTGAAVWFRINNADSKPLECTSRTTIAQGTPSVLIIQSQEYLLPCGSAEHLRVDCRYSYSFHISVGDTTLYEDNGTIDSSVTPSEGKLPDKGIELDVSSVTSARNVELVVSTKTTYIGTQYLNTTGAIISTMSGHLRLWSLPPFRLAETPSSSECAPKYTVTLPPGVRAKLRAELRSTTRHKDLDFKFEVHNQDQTVWTSPGKEGQVIETLDVVEGIAEFVVTPYDSRGSTLLHVAVIIDGVEFDAIAEDELPVAYIPRIPQPRPL